MTLKHPDITANRQAARLAAMDSVEKVEERWRAEHRKERIANLAATLKSLVAWVFLLVIIPGAAWYFFGDRVLPPEWTYPQVYERLVKFLNPEQPAPEPVKEEPRTDPADLATVKARAALKAVIKEVESLCKTEAPVQAKLGLVDKLRSSPGKRIFEHVITADRNYQEACERLAKMREKNDKLGLQRRSEGTSSNRKYLAQYSDREFATQQIRIDKTLLAAFQARLKAVERAHVAVKSAAAKWTGTESRADAAKMLAELETLHEKFLAKFKKDHPDLVSGNQPQQLGDRAGK